MAFVNHATKQMVFKVCWYGASAAALDANVQAIGQAYGVKVPRAGEVGMIPLTLGEHGGFKTEAHLYPIPAESPFPAQRLLLLKGSDGVIVLASATADPGSDPDAERVSELKAHLKSLGHDWARFPIVLQLHGGGTGHPTIRAESLGLGDRSRVEAPDLVTGTGAVDAVKAITRSLVAQMRARL